LEIPRVQRSAALEEQMRAVAERGLSLRATQQENYDALVALTRLLVDTLGGTSPTRGSDTAVRAHELFDLSLATNPPPRAPACRKGCGYCCRVYVSATAPEIFVIVRAMQTLPQAHFAQMRARIRDAAVATARDWSRDVFFTYQCPLLEDNACSLHPARPDACRGISSYSAEACAASIAGLALGRDEAVPKVDEHGFLRGLHAHALWAALQASGLAFTTYSMNQALDRALDTPDAEARWLAGEDIFAGMPQDSSLEGRDLAMVTATMQWLIADSTGQEPAS
jgi:Putative zinc- or iron-chelating domain